MPKKLSFYPRYIKSLLLESLKDSPTVLIQGPRQCGKTTLAQTAGEPKGYEYISFDDNVILLSAQEDPTGFIAQLPKKVILDEVQKAPHIFSALKMSVDKNKAPGRFILTGSANILSIPKLSDSLAGRMQILRLHPLSQEESISRRPYFLSAIFKCKFKKSKNTSSHVIDTMLTGGFPSVFKLPAGRRRTNWYRNYVDTILKRDIMDISKARSIEIIPKLLMLSSAHTAQLVNFTALSKAFQASRSTIVDYISLLEQMFFLTKLPPWHTSRFRRLIKTPKIHLNDTGLACAILGVNAESLKRNRPLLGQLLETFVFQELCRQASYSKYHHNFFYYRDKKGAEVDIVIERDYSIVGIEVKASATVNIGDFKGLLTLKKATGKRFVCGVVLYDGEMTLSFGNQLYAVPLNTL